MYTTFLKKSHFPGGNFLPPVSKIFDMSGKHESRHKQARIYTYACTMCTSCVGSCLYCLYACLWLPACLLAKPQGTLIVCCNVPRGKNLLAAPPEGCDAGCGGGQGNRDTFPVEIGLSLHQLLLQLQRGARRSLGTKPIGIQMGTHERALKK